MVRPALVVADPDLMASQPPAAAGGQRAERAGARARGPLHAVREPGRATPRPCARAALLAEGLRARPARPRRGGPRGAPGRLRVRRRRLRRAPRGVPDDRARWPARPHAETNAVMLPHSARLMAGARAGRARAPWPAALGDPAGDPGRGGRARWPSSPRRTGHTRLSELGVGEEHVARGGREAVGSIRRWATRPTRRARTSSPRSCARLSEPGRIAAMAGPLDGKVAVVTGASSGIGEATALALARAGAAVALGARRKERLDALAERISGEGGRAYVRSGRPDRRRRTPAPSSRRHTTSLAGCTSS